MTKFQILLEEARTIANSILGETNPTTVLAVYDRLVGATQITKLEEVLTRKLQQKNPIDQMQAAQEKGHAIVLQAAKERAKAFQPKTITQPKLDPENVLEEELDALFGKGSDMSSSTNAAAVARANQFAEFKPIKGAKLPTFFNRYEGNKCKSCKQVLKVGEAINWIANDGSYHPDCR